MQILLGRRDRPKAGSDARSFLPVRALTVAAIVILIAISLSLVRDSKVPSLPEGAMPFVRRVLEMLPRIGKEREDRFSGVYSWRIPAFPACDTFWGLPLATFSRPTAYYLKSIYDGRGYIANASELMDAINSTDMPADVGEVFCDPMTWRFWLNPFANKLPPANVYGSGPARDILKRAIIANRHQGYVSRTVRLEIAGELKQLRSQLSSEEQDRAGNVTLAIDVYSPLAAYANPSAHEITVSESLVRTVFVRAATAKVPKLRDIVDAAQRDQDGVKAARAIRQLASDTLVEVGRDLSFILAHELSHLSVPTIDEREADCYGLSLVVSRSKVPDIGVFRDVEEALASGYSQYWNGLPAAVITERFQLLQIWSEAARDGSSVKPICVEAWKALEKDERD
ncbi:hypothetical protein ELI00_37165 [Rhizobium ruizarguesonis]|uniref:hypothetical protein n=1 Tax=Rhizobium ruizarguesonis TaxID=2081791 RepID=UPI001031A493|nr:hypothetical protein [Rhizobium ruizarguesonis]TAX63573.1 hypothetical protein ELI00_37165 [Rhizobium ruizarguesonis]